MDIRDGSGDFSIDCSVKIENPPTSVVKVTAHLQELPAEPTSSNPSLPPPHTPVCGRCLWGPLIS